MHSLVLQSNVTPASFQRCDRLPRRILRSNSAASLTRACAQTEAPAEEVGLLLWTAFARIYTSVFKEIILTLLKMEHNKQQYSPICMVEKLVFVWSRKLAPSLLMRVPRAE